MSFMKSLALLVLSILVISFVNPAMGAEEKMKQPETRIVEMKTSEGKIRIELWADKAPETVKNFLRYVGEGLYDGTIFHRVIDNFMIQGGGFTADMNQKKTHEPIKNEAAGTLKNDRGTIAMARTNVVDSATSQFFINLKDNDFLNHRDASPMGFGYAVFGKVIEGMDVVDKIAKVPTANAGPHQNVPVKPVVIESAKVEK
jgi:cyclophilin family peptidyl-prolyl cis-trans isomerase